VPPSRAQFHRAQPQHLLSYVCFTPGWEALAQPHSSLSLAIRKIRKGRCERGARTIDHTRKFQRSKTIVLSWRCCKVLVDGDRETVLWISHVGLNPPNALLRRPASAKTPPRTAAVPQSHRYPPRPPPCPRGTRTAAAVPSHGARRTGRSEPPRRAQQWGRERSRAEIPATAPKRRQQSRAGQSRRRAGAQSPQPRSRGCHTKHQHPKRHL